MEGVVLNGERGKKVKRENGCSFIEVELTRMLSWALGARWGTLGMSQLFLAQPHTPMQYMTALMQSYTHLRMVVCGCAHSLHILASDYSEAFVMLGVSLRILCNADGAVPPLSLTRVAGNLW